MGCRSGMGAYEAGRGKIYSVYTVYSLQKARLHHWCGSLVDYCDDLISCLDSDSDGTHSLGEEAM